METKGGDVETKGDSPGVLTVHQPFGVVVTSPKEGPQVGGSSSGGVRASPHARDTRSRRRLLGKLLLPARASVRGLAGRWRRVGAPTLLLCFFAARLLPLISRGPACARKSADFARPGNRGGPVSNGPQCTCQNCSRSL